MALRLGLPLRDMEMVQFHPTGLLAGPRHAHDRHGAGGGPARRRRTPPQRRAASASWPSSTRSASGPRAISSRAASTRRCAPAAPRPHGGVYIKMGHLGPDKVRQAVQGHGGALRRLRLRSRRRPGRGGADGALLHGRAGLRGRYVHRAARPVRGRRGCRRRARRQPAGRQRRRQLHGLRRHRRRDDGRLDRGQSRASRPGRGRARRRDGPR